MSRGKERKKQDGNRMNKGEKGEEERGAVEWETREAGRELKGPCYSQHVNKVVVKREEE